jgi:uncharacterized membrane protein YoaK (UPF0700 family)
MDAIAFLVLGGVFTSAMSGNTIVLGLAIGQGHFTAALHAITALFGYLAGVAVAALSLARLGRGSGWTLGLEGFVLAAFAGLWLYVGEPAGSIAYALIVLSAVAMGLQGGIGRAIGAPGIMTVIFTSTYTSIVSNLVERALAREHPLITALAARQLAALASYLGGAVVIAIVATHWRSLAPFIPLAVILIVLAGLKLRLINFGPNATR